MDETAPHRPTSTVDAGETRTRQLEAELAAVREALQQTVRDLQATNVQLLEADRRKNEFLAMLGHELRNPLAAIRSAIELWQHPAAGQHLPQVQEVIDRQTRQLTRIVDDLLDLERITRGKVQLRLEEVDLRTICGHAAASAGELLRQRRHHFVLQLPPDPLPIRVDPARFEQVVVNLLNNAAKYTDEGGHVRLGVRRDGDQAVIEVQDDGIGLSADMLPRIFDMFSQAERSLDRSRGGLGIGLTLVRRLVAMHAGSVSAASAGPGHGSTFTVCLPALPASLEPVRVAAATEPVLAAATRPRRVLVVDDHHDLASSVAAWLRTLGHEVATAYDGPAALEMARQFRPDVVLLDLALPRLDGYEVARQLQADPRYAATCLIAVSGYVQSQDPQRSRQAGFRHHLVKPVDHDELLRLIQTAPPTAGEVRVDGPHVAMASQEQPDGAEPRDGGYRILLIDDDRMMTRIAQALLRRQGHTVVASHSGDEGLAALGEFRPQVVLCDLQLGSGKNGFEVAEAIRARRLEPAPLLVALSAHSREEVEARAVQCGFDLQLTKPVDFTHLGRTLAEAMAGRARKEEPRR